MTTRTMNSRVDALERREAPIAERWHWIIGEVGETHDQARARYQREHRPIGPAEDAVIWRIVDSKAPAGSC